MASDSASASSIAISDLLPGIVYVDAAVGSREFTRYFTGARPPYPHRVALASLRNSEGKAAGDFAFSCGHGARSPFCEGDFGCRIGIERKTIGDLVGSLLNNRLGGDQIPNMIDADPVTGAPRGYTFIYLIIEGIWRPGADDAIEVWERGGWRLSRYALTYSALSSWLTRYDVMGQGRIHRWRSSSTIESAAFVSSTYRWWNKEWKKHAPIVVDKIPKAQKVLTFRPNKLQQHLAAFDRIGTKRMFAISKGMPVKTLQWIVNASIAELEAIGIGKADARSIFAECRREFR